MGDKPIIRIAVPGETAEDFMQAAAKQFRSDFFVAIDQPVGKFVRIEAPFLNGDVGVRGDAIAMPAVRNGRKGLVIRLVKLDADSLGIPIQEQTKELSLDDDGDDDDDAVQEFDSSQATVASGVSAAVAQSIRAASSTADRAQPVKLQTPAAAPAAAVPQPVAKAPSKPTRLDELDDETREAVNEFGDVSTKASDLSDLAKQLAEPAAATKTTNTIKRTTPGSGIPRPEAPAPTAPAPTDDDAAFDAAFTGDESEAKQVHTKATAQLDALIASEDGGDDGGDAEISSKPPAPDDDEPILLAKARPAAAAEAKAAKRAPEPEPDADPDPEPAALEPATPPAQPSKAATTFLVVLILIALGAAAFFLIEGL